jgi:hypothetical protein
MYSPTVTPKCRGTAALPAASAAVQVHAVVPIGKVLPETKPPAHVQLATMPVVTESVTGGANVATAPADLVASIVLASPVEITGFVVSTVCTLEM